MSETNDLACLFHAHTKVRALTGEYEAAGRGLELERIKERMFELRSQHEPLNTITAGDTEERQRILDAIFYVVVGRHPERS